MRSPFLFFQNCDRAFVKLSRSREFHLLFLSGDRLPMKSSIAGWMGGWSDLLWFSISALTLQNHHLGLFGNVSDHCFTKLHQSIPSNDLE